MALIPLTSPKKEEIYNGRTNFLFVKARLIAHRGLLESQKMSVNLSSTSLWNRPQTTCTVAVLEVGQVIPMIWVTRVTFCSGQVGLIRFMKYPGLGSRNHTLCTNLILLIKTTYSTTWSHAHYSKMYIAKQSHTYLSVTAVCRFALSHTHLLIVFIIFVFV